ncbi:UbiE3 [Desulforapulum autotrophicum HRM2]|uniref:Demethylmenaquinone methyltransferase n=2 Tax=Desulforapulum autotrophicum TaxID=2296 RepID=C0QLU8_DESAH|nr:UbiE3 [Desulforapulum autotrophicum HRM2]
MNMELDFIREMFDSIAPKYDFLNRFLSLRQDVRWRREMVLAAEIPPTGLVLDVACGTCDVAMEARNQTGDAAFIIGTDFSPGMLTLGLQKLKKNRRFATIPLVCANALALPFQSTHFDAVLIAFGIRNIMDRKGALKQFHDALKPGGKMVVLELTAPERGLFRQIYLFYFKRILPVIGSLFSKNAGAYHYLPASVLKFPSPKKFSQIMVTAGFTDVRWKPMTFGIVTLFAGTKK